VSAAKRTGSAVALGEIIATAPKAQGGNAPAAAPAPEAPAAQPPAAPALPAVQAPAAEPQPAGEPRWEGLKPKGKIPRRQLNVGLPESLRLHERLNVYATLRGVDVQDVVADAIHEYLNARGFTTALIENLNGGLPPAPGSTG